MTYNFINAASMPNDEVFVSRNLIAGEWREGLAGVRFERHSPAHGTLVSNAPKSNQADAEAAIAAARNAFDNGTWSKSSGGDRAGFLLSVADLIDRERERIARLEVLESGKPISQARDEIAGAADIWRYAAALARTVSGETHNALGNDMLGMVLKQPIGVVSLITPWNFPFLILTQKLPFALAAGCTAVIKPSEYTPSSATILCELLVEAGLPAGVVNLVHGFGDPVGVELSNSPLVDMVSFTGSTAVGKMISAAASKTLKKVASELGGKNPQVLFEDANIDASIDAIVFGIFFNAGECCNSGSRLIVHEDIKDQVLAKIMERSRSVPFGDPLDERTKVGALISTDHLEKVDWYVAKAREAGATINLGGATIPNTTMPGQFYAPTIVSDITPDMPIAREEVFGPVLSVLTFSIAEEALRLVNESEYGLSAGVWSENIHTCMDFVRRAEAGTIWVNTWMDGFPEIPFGGFKQSGQGRELGKYGIDEFLEIKTVQVRIGDTRSKWLD